MIGLAVLLTSTVVAFAVTVTEAVNGEFDHSTLGYETSTWPETTTHTLENSVLASLAEKSFDNLTAAEDVFEYLKVCPKYKAPLNVICHEPRYTCVNRCGHFLNRFGRGGFSLDVCSCDVFCLAYGDCCWDFEDTCQSKKEEFHRDHAHRLQNLQFSCEKDIIFIEGYGPISNELNSKNSIPVSHKTLGLTFSSLITFQHYFSNSSLNNNNGIEGLSIREEDLVYWTKEFLILLPIDSLKELKKVVEDSDPNYKNLIVTNIEPEIMLRRCKPRVNLLCLSNSENRTDDEEGGDVREGGGNRIGDSRNRMDVVAVVGDGIDGVDDIGNKDEDGDGGDDSEKKVGEVGKEGEEEEDKKEEETETDVCNGLSRILTLSSLEPICGESLGYVRTEKPETPPMALGPLILQPNFPAFSSTPEMIPSDSLRQQVTPSTTTAASDKGEKEETQNCYLNWRPYLPPRDKVYSLKIVFTVDSDEKELGIFEVKVKSRSRGAFVWDDISCTKKIDEKEGCNLEFVCKAGYLKVDGECRLPKKLIVQVLGNFEVEQNTVHNVLAGVLYTIAHQHLAKDLSISDNKTTVTTRTTDVNGKNQVRIHSEITLTKYNLTVLPSNGTKYQLPVTPGISSYLSLTYQNDTTPVQQVVICFETEKPISNRFFLRDEEMVDGNDARLISCDVLNALDNFQPKHYDVRDIGELPQLDRDLVYDGQSVGSGAERCDDSAGVGGVGLVILYGISLLMTSMTTL